MGYRLGRIVSCISLMGVAAWGQPAISSYGDGYVNAPTSSVPGGQLIINGANLASGAVDCYSGGLPLVCGNTWVSIGGYSAPLLYVSPAKLIVFVPYEANGSSPMYVHSDFGANTSDYLNVVPALPYAGMGFSDNGVLVTGQTPATAGDTVSLVATGLGAVNPPPTDGVAIPYNSPYHPTGSVQVTVGGVLAKIVSPATLTYYDQYSLSFQVPSGLTGNQPVILSVGGISSSPVTIQLTGSPTPVSVTTPTALGTYSWGEVQLALSAVGGNGSYSWTLQSGTIPTGLSIRGDLPASVLPWAPNGLIGVATTPGTYNFTLGVSSGGSSTSAPFTMKITALTLNDGPVLPDGFVGAPYYGAGYQLSATNGSITRITCAPNTNGGLSLNNGCLISGTPTTAGVITIPVTFTEGSDTLTKNVYLTVYPVRITEPGELPNAVQFQPYSVTLHPVGKAPFTYALSGILPPGLTWVGGPTISGQPNGAPGKTNFSFMVTDANGQSYTKNMSIDVVGVPETLPQLAAYSDQIDCTIGVGCSNGVAVTSGGVGPFTWMVTGLPPGMDFRYGSGTTSASVGAGDVEIWGAPALLGYFYPTVTVTDANGRSVTQNFELHVAVLLFDTCGYQPACQMVASGQVGSYYATQFRLVGGTPPYVATYNPGPADTTGFPAGLLMGNTGVTGMPLEAGQFFPPVQFNDSASIVNYFQIPLPILIYGPSGSSTTIANYPALYTTAGQPFELQLSACCAPSYKWTVSSSQPLPAGLSLSSTGLISGTPSGQSIPPLTVQATDSGNPDNYGTRQLVFNVSTISIPTNALPDGIVNASYNYTLSAGGSGATSWQAPIPGLLPPGLTFYSNGSVTGTPGNPGEYAFPVIATNSQSTTQKTVTLSIYSACDPMKAGFESAAGAGQFVREALAARGESQKTVSLKNVSS